MMDLPSLLRAQDDNLSQMQGLLAEEFDLLKAHRALALPALADRKQQLLVAIEMLDKTLAELPVRDSSSLTYDAKGNTRSGTRSFGIKA